ncbi:MAG: hypothetical protein JO338_06545 [Aquitalea sp.]|nr:hypothetical protein [Aquitalea sp.]
MWFVVLVLAGFAVAALAGVLGGALRKVEPEARLESGAGIPGVDAGVLLSLRRGRDEAWTRRPWPYIRDRLTFPPLDAPVVNVSSAVSEGKVYRVDPAALTCSCKYFLLRGARAEVGSKERLCRHLRQVYADRGVLAPVVKMVLLDDVHFCETDQLWSGEVEGVPVAIAWREGDPWVAIYTQSNQLNQEPEFQRYNFHLDRACWADGRMPKYNATAIRQMLADWFGDQRLSA